MLIQVRYLFFLVLIVVTVTGKEDWYQINTQYGTISVDSGYARVVGNSNEKPTLFKEINENNAMVISIMDGPRIGYFMGYDGNYAMGATGWSNRGTFTWQGCKLLLNGVPLSYHVSGYFYFHQPDAYNTVVCISKVYPYAPKAKCTATSIVGSWKYMSMLAGKTTITLTHGTSKRHEESKSTEWSNSVSVVSETSMEIKGTVSTTLTIGYEFRNTMTDTYSDEWSTSEEESYSVEIAEGDKGKALWQFVFIIKDTCDHQESTYLKEYAITASKKKPPCCLPGYTTDAPYYTICTAEEDRIEKTLAHCTVAVDKRELLRQFLLRKMY